MVRTNEGLKLVYKGKGKTIPLRALTGPEDSRRLRLPDFQDNRHMKEVRLPALRTSRFNPPGIIPGTQFCCVPGSLVGIATGYGLDGPGIESQWGQDFSHTFRPALGPTQPPVQGLPGL
jgi:hypothetical protein